MNYDLAIQDQTGARIGLRKSLRELYKYMRGTNTKFIASFIFLLINSVTIVWTPFLIGDITNKYIPTGDKENLLRSLIFLGAVYLIGGLFSYLQIWVMGQVGQQVVYNLRQAVFTKLQNLPLQFFNQNKSGDLISRINNDTEKMSQAFSETLLRFTGDIVVTFSIAAIMLYLNFTLGMIALITLGLMLLITWGLYGWIKSRLDISLQRVSEMSGAIQESLNNFKVTVVFNRRDYFRDSFEKVNENNRKAATWAGIAVSTLAPIYNYAGTLASGIILVFGIQILFLDKIAAGQAPEFGSLLAFILYANSFFGPLKEMSELFSQMQVALASWSRIFRLLKLESNLEQTPDVKAKKTSAMMHFHNVSFGYDKENMILKKINMELEPGKTYALVGPTGGGKSTTASLMVRLYDVSEGQIFYAGKDIRSYEPEDLANEIGFILQEPFLFSGTIAENICYGNENLRNITDEELTQKLASLNLEELISRFSEGLQTVINPGAENISLGQRQLISFVRILLREPKLLILDEATANVDTVTEKLLEEILQKLPASTTKVIIAHRLNTIEKADQIFFISNGRIEKPLDFNAALGLINQSKTAS